MCHASRYVSALRHPYLSNVRFSSSSQVHELSSQPYVELIAAKGDWLGCQAYPKYTLRVYDEYHRGTSINDALISPKEVLDITSINLYAFPCETKCKHHRFKFPFTCCRSAKISSQSSGMRESIVLDNRTGCANARVTSGYSSRSMAEEVLGLLSGHAETGEQLRDHNALDVQPIAPTLADVIPKVTSFFFPHFFHSPQISYRVG